MPSSMKAWSASDSNPVGDGSSSTRLDDEFVNYDRPMTEPVGGRLDVVEISGITVHSPREATAAVSRLAWPRRVDSRRHSP